MPTIHSLPPLSAASSRAGVSIAQLPDDKATASRRKNIFAPAAATADPFFRTLDEILATEASTGALHEDFLHNQRKLLRDIRLRDMLSAIEEFWHASGTERRGWREHALWQIKIFREKHLIPEAAAFRAVVERSKAARRPGG